MVIGAPLGISPPRYGGDGPRGGGGGYGRPRTPDRYQTYVLVRVPYSDVAGTETSIGRSPGIGADLPAAAAVEVVMTWGSEVPRTGVDLGMVTGTTSGDHLGDLQGDQCFHNNKQPARSNVNKEFFLGVLHLVTTEAIMEEQFHQCRMGTAARRG